MDFLPPKDLSTHYLILQSDDTEAVEIYGETLVQDFRGVSAVYTDEGQTLHLYFESKSNSPHEILRMAEVIEQSHESGGDMEVVFYDIPMA